MSIALAGETSSPIHARLNIEPLRENFQADSIRAGSHITAARRPMVDLSSGSKLGAKSLFKNILPISPCGSIFWQDQPVSRSRKPLEINILKDRRKKSGIGPER
jgi:hypothetical protein